MSRNLLGVFRENFGKPSYGSVFSVLRSKIALKRRKTAIEGFFLCSWPDRAEKLAIFRKNEAKMDYFSLIEINLKIGSDNGSQVQVQPFLGRFRFRFRFGHFRLINLLSGSGSGAPTNSIFDPTGPLFRKHKAKMDYFSIIGINLKIRRFRQCILGSGSTLLV